MRACRHGTAVQPQLAIEFINVCWASSECSTAGDHDQVSSCHLPLAQCSYWPIE